MCLRADFFSTHCPCVGPSDTFFFPLYTFSLPIFCIIRTAQFEPARSELTSRSPTCECGHFSFVSNRAIRGPVFQSTFHTWSYLYESMVAVGRTQVSLTRDSSLSSSGRGTRFYVLQVSDGPPGFEINRTSRLTAKSSRGSLCLSQTLTFLFGHAS